MTPHEHARIAYGQQWKALLSKKHNVLKNFISYKGDCAGRYATIEQFGELDLEEKVARHEDKPAIEMSTARVFIFPRSFNRTVKFDEDDSWKLDRIGVPMPQAAARLMQAGQRKMESLIFAGMLDDNTIGNGADEAMTTEALGAGQTVAVDFEDGATNTGLTSAKIIEGVRLFMENNAYGQDAELDQPDQLCLGASPSSLLNLYNESVVTNQDFRSFAGGRPYDTGILESFFGVKLLVTTGLADRKAADIQDIPMWLKSKVTYGDWKSAESDVWRDKNTGGDRIRFKFTGGACREQKEGVVLIKADESA